MTTLTEIQWRASVEAATAEAVNIEHGANPGVQVMIEVFSPKCIGCKNMEERTWSEGAVQSAIESNFVPVQVNVLEHPEAMKPPLMAFWTPTIIVTCPDKNIHRRWTGFLPPREFLGELALSRVGYALTRQSFEEARSLAEEAVAITEGDPLRNSEAHYWHAVASYKATDNQELLIQGWKKLLSEHPDSEWALRCDFAASM